MTSKFVGSILRGRASVLASVAMAAFTLAAHADPMITNGSFETTSAGSGWINNGTTVTGWTSTGYNFVFNSTTAAAGVPGSGGNVALAANVPASPDGGNFLAMNGAFMPPSIISQTITGLTVGAQETITFYYAGAQQKGFMGATTEGFAVSLGGQTQDTPILNNASQGFTGWQKESLTFTATSTSELLSFMAIDGPAGDPPNTLLDGVSITQSQTPEPGTITLLGTGLAGLAGVVRRRFKKA
jgi:hypothetical protein